MTNFWATNWTINSGRPFLFSRQITFFPLFPIFSLLILKRYVVAKLNIVNLNTAKTLYFSELFSNSIAPVIIEFGGLVKLTMLHTVYQVQARICVWYTLYVLIVCKVHATVFHNVVMPVKKIHKKRQKRPIAGQIDNYHTTHTSSLIDNYRGSANIFAPRFLARQPWHFADAIGNGAKRTTNGTLDSRHKARRRYHLSARFGLLQ